jgi:hypothetical protein
MIDKPWDISIKAVRNQQPKVNNIIEDMEIHVISYIIFNS